MQRESTMAGRADLTVAFVVGCLVFLSDCRLVPAFLPPVGTRRQPLPSLGFSVSVSATTRYARSPPAASFDLASIEAFEKKLDRVEATVPATWEGADAVGSDSRNESNDVRTVVVPPNLNSKRIDAAIAALDDTLSRSVCGKLVADGNVCVVTDGVPVVIDRKSFKVSTSDQLRITVPRTQEPTEIVPQDIPIDILFEDEHMIVLNKAAGMVVHPAVGNWDGTVVNALAHYLPNSEYGTGNIIERDSVGGSDESKEEQIHTNGDGNDDDDSEDGVTFRPGIVHRLDKGTTGVLVVAKTTQALAALSASFAARKVRKTYLAITVGNPGKRAVIDKPIGRHPVHRQKMRVVPNHHNQQVLPPRGRVPASMEPLPASQAGRRALSFVDTQAFDGRLSLVQVRIETGRTHQIRVHLSDRRTPVYGDDVYGLPDWNKRLFKTHMIERPLLHAWKLEIDHPVTGEPLAFQAPLADDMRRIAKAIWPEGESARADIFA